MVTGLPISSKPAKKRAMSSKLACSCTRDGRCHQLRLDGLWLRPLTTAVVCSPAQALSKGITSRQQFRVIFSGGSTRYQHNDSR